jgi:hypothetical protein
MIHIHSTNHEVDPTLTHSFLFSFLVIHTIPWLRSILQRFRFSKSHLLNLLRRLVTLSLPPSTVTTSTADSTFDLECHNGIPYVKLNGEYHHCLRESWTNDPNKLYLEICFDPQLDVNLANDFNIDGLCPVVKAINGDRFILRDAQERYYLWDAWNGNLQRFWDTWTEGYSSKEQLVANLVCNMTWAEMNTDIIHSPGRG